MKTLKKPVLDRIIDNINTLVPVPKPVTPKGYVKAVRDVPKRERQNRFQLPVQ
jgi:hypothetical protein